MTEHAVWEKASVGGAVSVIDVVLANAIDVVAVSVIDVVAVSVIAFVVVSVIVFVAVSAIVFVAVSAIAFVPAIAVALANAIFFVLANEQAVTAHAQVNVQAANAHVVATTNALVSLPGSMMTTFCLRRC